MTGLTRPGQILLMLSAIIRYLDIRWEGGCVVALLYFWFRSVSGHQTRPNPVLRS